MGQQRTVEASPTRQGGLLAFLSGQRRARSVASTSRGEEEEGGSTMSRRRASSSSSGRSTLGVRRFFALTSPSSRRRGPSSSSLSSSVSSSSSKMSELTVSGGLRSTVGFEDFATSAASLFQTQQSAGIGSSSSGSSSGSSSSSDSSGSRRRGPSEWSVPAEEEATDAEAVEGAVDEDFKLTAASAMMAATGAGTIFGAWGEEDGFPSPGGDWLGALPPCDSPRRVEAPAAAEQQAEAAVPAAVVGAQPAAKGATLPASQFVETVFFSVAQGGDEEEDDDDAQSEWGAVTAAATSSNPFFETAVATAPEVARDESSSSIGRAQWPFADEGEEAGAAAEAATTASGWPDELPGGIATTVSLPTEFFDEQETPGGAAGDGGGSGPLGVTLPWDLFEEQQQQPAQPRRQGTLGHTLPEGMFEEQQPAPQRQGALGHTLPEGMFEEGADTGPMEEGEKEETSMRSATTSSTAGAAGARQQQLEEAPAGAVIVLEQLKRRRAAEKRKRLGLSMELLEQMLRAAHEAALVGPAEEPQAQRRPLPQLPSMAAFSFYPPTSAFAPLRAEPPLSGQPGQPALPPPAAVVAGKEREAGQQLHSGQGSWVGGAPEQEGQRKQQQQRRRRRQRQEPQQQEEAEWDHQPLPSLLQQTAALVPLLDDSDSEGPSDDEEEEPSVEEAAGPDDEESDDGVLLDIEVVEPQEEEEAEAPEPHISDIEADAILLEGLTHMRRTVALHGAGAGRLLADPTCPLAGALDRLALGSQLVTLELSGHGLLSLDAVALAFACLKVLRHLDLSRNQLASMRCPPGHRYPPTLQALVLRHNALTEIADLEGGAAASLRSLDVAHNRIRRVDGMAGLTKLASLDLSHNALTKPIDLRLLSFAPAITQLALAGNPVLRGLAGGGKAAALALLPRLEMLDGRPVRRALRKAPPKPPTSPPPTPLPSRREQASADVRRAYAHVLAERARARARTERAAQEEAEEQQYWKPPAVPAAQQRAHVEELAQPRLGPAASMAISAGKQCWHRHHALCDKPLGAPKHPVGGRLYPPPALVAARRADILRGLIARQLDGFMARQGWEHGQEQQQGAAAFLAGGPEREEEVDVEEDGGSGSEKDGEEEGAAATAPEEATVDRWLAIVEADTALSKAALQVALQVTEAVLLERQLIALPPADMVAQTGGSLAMATMALARLPEGHEGALVLAAAGRELARVGRQLESTCRQLQVLRRVALPRRLLLAAAEQHVGNGDKSSCALVVRRAERTNALKRDLAAFLQHMLVVAPRSTPGQSGRQQQQQHRPPRVLELGVGAPEKEEAAAVEEEDRVLALPLLCATLREAHDLPLLTNGSETRTPVSSSSPFPPSSSFAASPASFPPSPASPSNFRTADTSSQPWNRSGGGTTSSSSRSSSTSSSRRRPQPAATGSPRAPPDLDRGRSQRAAATGEPDLTAYLTAQSRELYETAAAAMDDDANDANDADDDARFETAAGGFGTEGGGDEAEWLQGWDDHYASHFYHNTRTGRSQWTPPEDAPFLPCDDEEGGRTETTTARGRRGGLRRSPSKESGADGGSPRKTVTFSPRLVTVQQLED